MYESGAYSGPANKGCGFIIEEKRFKKYLKKMKWNYLVKHYIFNKGGNPCKAWISIEKCVLC